MHISRNEKSLRDTLRKARVRPESGGCGSIIYNAAHSICKEGRVFYVLTAIPDRFDDTFEILVDDKLVVRFELSRNIPTPTNVEILNIDEYKKNNYRKRGGQKINIAIEYARSDIDSCNY